MSLKAMILAAGSGTRLMPLTALTPKPMLPIDGRPLLQHVVEYLVRSHVDHIVINLHHHPEVITNHFGDGHKWGVDIVYSYESQLLGTAGAVKKVSAIFNEPFLVVYGDNLTNCKLDQLAKSHARNEASVTVALYRRNDVSESGVAELEGTDRIVRFVEKPRSTDVTSTWVNAGILMLQPEVLEMIPEERVCDFGRDVLPNLLVMGKRIYGYRMTTGEHLSWIDTPEDYKRLCTTALGEND